MVIVAGHITVDPEQRESCLAAFMRVVEKARRADGCLDFVITADLLDPAMRSASVAECDVADARRLSRNGRA
jgi:quinol monooxygenase YgiN